MDELRQFRDTVQRELKTMAINDELASWYLQSIYNHKYRISRSDELELAKQIATTGDTQAKHLLLQSYRAMVVHIASKYVDRGASAITLILAGEKGLNKALNKYQFERGYRFGTYATWWIKQKMLRTIDPS